MDKYSSSSADAHFTVSDWPVIQMQHLHEIIISFFWKYSTNSLQSYYHSYLASYCWFLCLGKSSSDFCSKKFCIYKSFWFIDAPQKLQYRVCHWSTIGKKVHARLNSSNFYVLCFSLTFRLSWLQHKYMTIY